MDTSIIVTIIGTLATILGGVFALIKYMTTETRKSQRTFLDHLEKKNEHLERATERHMKSTDKFANVVERFTNQLNELTRATNEVSSMTKASSNILYKISQDHNEIKSKLEK